MTLGGRPRVARLLLAAVLGLLPLASPAGAATLPRTGFEQRGGASWTTLAEEAKFLSRLDAVAGSRLRIVVVGKSRLGRNIRLVIAGPSRTRARIAAGRSALFVCAQHGNEPAGREACLQRMRSHAASSSAQVVLFMPTPNPDGVAANTRGNSSGVDVNRTHASLATAEAKAIAAVMSGYRPDVVNDLHEYQAEGDHYVRTRGDTCYGPTVEAPIKRLSIEHRHQWQEPSIEAGGFATAAYSSQVISTSLMEISARKHIVGGLTETPRRGTLSPVQRVAAQKRSIDGTLRMRSHRGDELAAATEDAGRY